MDNRDRIQLFPPTPVPVPEYCSIYPRTRRAIRSEFYMRSQDSEIVLGAWTFPTAVLRGGLPPLGTAKASLTVPNTSTSNRKNFVGEFIPPPNVEGWRRRHWIRDEMVSPPNCRSKWPQFGSPSWASLADCIWQNSAVVSSHPHAGWSMIIKLVDGCKLRRSSRPLLAEIYPSFVSACSSFTYKIIPLCSRF